MNRIEVIFKVWTDDADAGNLIAFVADGNPKVLEVRSWPHTEEVFRYLLVDSAEQTLTNESKQQ